MPEVGGLHAVNCLASLDPFSGALASTPGSRIKILEYSCCCLSWMCLFRAVLGRQRLHVLRLRWLPEGFRSYPPCGRDCPRRLLAESHTFSVVVCFWDLRGMVICAHSILQLQYLPVVCLLEPRRFEKCTQSMLQLTWYISRNCAEWRSVYI